MDRRELLKGLLALPAAVVVACATKREAEPASDPLPYCAHHTSEWKANPDGSQGVYCLRCGEPNPIPISDPALLHHGARFEEPQPSPSKWYENYDPPKMVPWMMDTNTVLDLDKEMSRIWFDEYCRG